MANEVALPPDQIAAMIKHMNDDHADSVLGYVHYYAKLPAAESATLVSMDANGMLVHAVVDGGDTLIAMARAEGH
jgi:putative heme iron utilization protein